MTSLARPAMPVAVAAAAGGDGLITPFPRDTGRLVLAVDDRGQELRLHETTPGFWQAYRWHHMHLGWCGGVAWGMTPREWTAVGETIGDRERIP